MDDNTVKDVRNLFKLKKESKAIKIRIIRDIQNLFEHEVTITLNIKVTVIDLKH